MKSMGIWKIIMITSLLCAVGISSFGCASKSDSTAMTENQVVTVQRGDLIIDITASGNLKLSRTADLAFELAGTVEEVLVEEGDSVKEGEVLAKLDTSEWEDQLTAKERDLLQAEINLKNAEIALETAEDSWLDTVSAGRAVSRAKKYLEWLAINEPANTDELAYTSIALRQAWDHFLSVASDSEEVLVKELGVELTQARLEDAQKALEETSSVSPEIIAPFGGFVTKVNVEGGDEALKGTVAVQLADPTKFEADVMVSEMDILQVKVGGKANVQVDAMPGLSLPSEVTHISPTATIQSGVVNYKVKVELQSLQPVTQQKPEAKPQTIQEAIDKMIRGELPEGFKQAVKEGRITQEQAEETVNRVRQGIESGLITREQVEEMMKQRLQEQGGQQGQMPTMIPEDFQLREGLTVTVNILVEERNDVLLVPNSAITSWGMETYVQISKDGVIEDRLITIGISNWQYTEVIDGLSEGEEVVIPQTTTTPTTPQPRRPLPFLPGGGSPH